LATYHAIAATSQAILNLLASACPSPELAFIRFELYQPRNFQNPMSEGVSLYLYRVHPSGTGRNLPPRTSPGGQRFRPALPLDLHYLLTAWAGDPLKQQRILGWTARALADAPVLPVALLNQSGSGSDTFQPGETLEIVFETLSIADMNAVWGFAAEKQQPSLAFTARMIAIESLQPATEPGPAGIAAAGTPKPEHA
jgi:hypothetical protein